jgi:hypothetical protein
MGLFGNVITIYGILSLGKRVPKHKTGYNLLECME